MNNNNIGVGGGDDRGIDWQEETKNLIVQYVENKHCADCLATETEWASINLGIFVCINCSGVHRSLGTHISKVRSITLDQTVWNREIYQLMSTRGNHISNSYWECNALPFEKPLAHDPYHYRQRYIENKYAKKKFVASPSNISYKLERDFSIDMVNMRGVITKQGGTRKNWRRRYAVLNGNILNYFVDEHDSYPKGSLELMHDHMIVFVDEDDARITAGGTAPNRKNCFAIVTKQRHYLICCEQEEQAARWVYALRAAVYYTNLRDVLNDPRNFLRGGESKSVEKVGFLKKQGGGWASIKKRYFRLRNNKLAYYKSEKELEPIDEIDLKGVKISNGAPTKDKKLQFCIMLSTNSRQYFFYADSAAEQKAWIDVLQAVANTVSDLQLVQAKSSAIHNLILNRMIHGKDRGGGGGSGSGGGSIGGVNDVMKPMMQQQQQDGATTIITPHSPMMWKTVSFHRCKPMDATFLARVEDIYGASLSADGRPSSAMYHSTSSGNLLNVGSVGGGAGAGAGAVNSSSELAAAAASSSSPSSPSSASMLRSASLLSSSPSGNGSDLVARSLMGTSPDLYGQRGRKVSLRYSIETMKSSPLSPTEPQSPTSSSSPSSLSSFNNSHGTTNLHQNRNSMPVIPTNLLMKDSTEQQKQQFTVKEEFSNVQLSTKNRLLLPTKKNNKDSDGDSVVIVSTSRVLPHNSRSDEDSDDDDLEDLNALISDSLKVAQMGEKHNDEKLSTNVRIDQQQHPSIVVNDDNVDDDGYEDDEEDEENDNCEIVDITPIPLRRPFSTNNLAATMSPVKSDPGSDDAAKNNSNNINNSNSNNSNNNNSSSDAGDDEGYEEEEPVLVLSSSQSNLQQQQQQQQEEYDDEEESASSEESSDDEDDDGGDDEPEIIMGQFTTEDISSTAFPEMDQPLVRKASVMVPTQTILHKPKAMTSFRKMHTFMQPTLQEYGVPVLD